MKDEHVRDEHVKDAAQDVAKNETRDAAEDVLGAAEDGSVKVFIVAGGPPWASGVVQIRVFISPVGAI